VFATPWAFTAHKPEEDKTDISPYLLVGHENTHPLPRKVSGFQGEIFRWAKPIPVAV
jgi:hypothetical protein